MTKPADDDELIQCFDSEDETCCKVNINDRRIKALITSREKRVAEEILYTISAWLATSDSDLEEVLIGLRKKYLTEEPGKEGE